MVKTSSGAHSSDKVASCKSEACQERKKKRCINAEVSSKDNRNVVLLKEASSLLQAG